MFLENVIPVENIQQPFAVPNVIFTYVTRAILKQPLKVIKKLENVPDAKKY